MWSSARVRLPQAEGERPVRLTQGPQRACVRSSLGPSLGRHRLEHPGPRTYAQDRSIHLPAYRSTTTRCRPPPCGVKGLRSHPRASGRGIYAQSCKRTSENSPSETVWKIAEGVSPRLSGGKKRPNWDSFHPSWPLSEPPFGTYSEFPNSFSTHFGE